MTIGILKEPSSENRVALLPEIVLQLVKMNVAVKVENGAGEKSFAADKDYQAAGATISDRSDILLSSDLIISINRIGDDDLSKLKSNAAVLSVFQPLINKDYSTRLLD